MRRGYIPSFIVVLGVWWTLPQIALGYPYPGVEDPSGDSATGLYAMGRNEEVAQLSNPGNSLTAASGLEAFASSLVGRSSNPNIWCANGNCNEIGNTPPPQPEPGVRQRSLNSLSPMSGFQSIVNSMAYSNQAANALVAPITLMNVALQLTEPGISAGVSIGLSNVNQWVQSRFLSNLAFIANATVSPEGILALRAYQDCMYRKMSASTDRKTWPQADAECQGGEAITNTSGVTPFSSVSPVGFNLQDDADHPSSFNNIGVPNGNPNEMKLTDYLFNSETNPGDPQALNAIRGTFLETIGDIVFSITPGNTGARRFTHTKVRPTILPEELHRRHTTVAYNVIHDLLFGLCGRLNPGQVMGPPSPFRTSYFRLESTQELMGRLAVVGHMTGMPEVQAFYREFEESLGRTRGESVCDELRSWEDRPTNIDNIASGGQWGSNATRLSRIIFSYALMLGRLKTLNTYIAAEQLIKGLSAGAFDGATRSLALDMVYGVAGTRDIQGEYDNVLAKVREFARILVSENQDSGRLR